MSTTAVARPSERGSDPPVSRPRIAGIDATRGVALIGMIAVHALVATDAAGSVTTVYSVSAGRSAAIFAVMAGVGIAFITGRDRVPATRAGRTAAGMTARALVIGVIGLALGYTDIDVAAVILPFYAVLFVLAIPLVFLGNRALVVTSAVIALGMPFLSHALRVGLPAARPENPSFGLLFSDPARLLAELTLTGSYPALPWLAYIGAGLVIGRMSLTSKRVAAWLLATGSVLAAGAWLVTGWLLGPLGGLDRIQAAGTGPLGLAVEDVLTIGPGGVTPTTTWWWLAVQGAHTTTPPDLVHTIGVAAALLGALLLLGHVTAPAARRVVTVVLGPLAAAGSMVLTLYAAHIVFLNSSLDVFGTTTSLVVQIVVALLFALGWRQAVGRGPLETVASWAAQRAQRPKRKPAHAA